MSKKDRRVDPTTVRSSYDPAVERLTIHVSLTARPADYEAINASADLEVSCPPDKLEETFNQRCKFLRSSVGDAMGKLMRDYDKGVAASYRQAAKRAK